MYLYVKDQYRCENVDPYSTTGVMGASENCTFQGLERLEELGFETDWLWYDALALVIYSTILLIIAYAILSLIKKEK